MMYFILISGVLNLFIAILVLRAGKKDKNLASFALLCIFTAIWTLHNFLMFYFDELIYLRPIYFFGAVTISSLLAWAFYYTEENSKHWKQALIYLAGVLAGSLSFIDGVVINKVNSITISGIDVQTGKYFYIYASFILICFVWALAKLLLAYRKSIGEKRKQLKLILFGVVAYGGVSILVSAILPAFHNFNYTNLDSPSSLIFAIFTAIAIVKNRFLGKKIVVAQILIALLLSVSAVEVTFSANVLELIFRAFFFLILFIIGISLIENIALDTDRKESLQEMADKLASANDQLRKLDNAKSEFISIASHQLRTPLTAIKGFLSLVLEGTYGELNNPNIAAALNKVYYSSEMLIQLVEDLLNVSRIESGRMDIKIEKANLENVIKDLYENFSLTAKDKKLYLDYKIGEGSLPEVPMDAAKMREVFSNLIDNSIKYTERGGVTIRGEVKEEENGTFVRITISDTGVGIPETEIPYLFKKFSRGKDISRLHANGTGLGLYVGKNIVEAHKGKIWIESEGLGRGSKFIVELPV